MCCFSRPVRAVGATRVFARALTGNRQAVAYAMHYEADEPLALVLPLRVPDGTHERDVSWLDLTACPDLFERLDARIDGPAQPSRGALQGASAGHLEVARVGSFEASFAPTATDLSRLDPRFRLPAQVLTALPAVATLGFVVAQLRPEATTVHPLAFTFPRRDPALVVFPTLHVHDGHVHRTARFDHALYVQGVPRQLEVQSTWLARVLRRGRARDRWQVAARPVGDALARDSAGLLDPALPLARMRVVGRHTNQDITVST